jgi:adenosine kinase
LSSPKLACEQFKHTKTTPRSDEATLAKYGLKPNDAILAEEKHMGLYEDLLQNHDAKLIAGGAAQNTARGAQVAVPSPLYLCPILIGPVLSYYNPSATQWPLEAIAEAATFRSLILHSPPQYILPPSSVLYIGCVGSDQYASHLRSACAQAGLRVEYQLSPSNSPTGRCGVIITGQNRSMCTHLAAANDYKLSHLQSPEIWKLVQQAKVYYVGGYHLTVCPEAAMALAKEAAKENKIFVLSLSAPFIPQFFKTQVDETAPYWDYVIGNETEARSWAGVHDECKEKEDVKVIARHLTELPKENRERKRVVVVTQGTDETVLAVQGEEGVRTFKVREIGTQEICDTNGAG